MSAHLIAPETVDDTRFERIDGQLIERPVPLSPHACAQSEIHVLLREALRGSNGRAYTEGPSHDRNMPTGKTPITSARMSWSPIHR